MKNHWLVCWVGDGGDSESYSVFYTKVVQAETKDEALEKGISAMSFSSVNKEHYHAEPIGIENYVE